MKTSPFTSNEFSNSISGHFTQLVLGLRCDQNVIATWFLIGIPACAAPAGSGLPQHDSNTGQENKFFTSSLPGASTLDLSVRSFPSSLLSSTSSSVSPFPHVMAEMVLFSGRAQHRGNETHSLENPCLDVTKKMVK